jgi:hypothetical protein
LSWAIATFALFDIVNSQLAVPGTMFFDINGGNDLLGIFMAVNGK